MTGVERALLVEFVAGLLFIAALYVYQGRRTRTIDAVAVLFVAAFVVLAAVFVQPLLRPYWGWLRAHDLRNWNNAAFAVTWNALLLALLREWWRAWRGP